MKKSTFILLGLILIFLSACSQSIAEPKETLIPSITLQPTNTPTTTITPSPTLTPTITVTPTPLATPIAGSNGLYTFCANSHSIYDLPSQSRQYIELPDRKGSYLDLKLFALGIPIELLNLFNLPSEYLSPCCFSLMAVSRDNNSALFMKTGSESILAKLVWINFETQEIKEIYEGDIFVEQTRRRIKHNHVVDEVYFTVSNPYYYEPRFGDIFAVDMGNGNLFNITESQESKANKFGVSNDGKKIAYSADEGLWIFDRETTNHKLLYRRNMGGVDWHPTEDLIVFNSSDGVVLIDSQGGNIRKIESIIGNIGYLLLPHWTPDGKLAAWVKTEGSWWEESEGTWSWIIIDIDKGEYKLFESFESDNLLIPGLDNFVFSPDHKWFAAEAVVLTGENSGVPQSYVCNIEEGECYKVGPRGDNLCMIINWIDPKISINSILEFGQ